MANPFDELFGQAASTATSAKVAWHMKDEAYYFAEAKRAGEDAVEALLNTAAHQYRNKHGCSAVQAQAAINARAEYIEGVLTGERTFYDAAKSLAKGQGQGGGDPVPA
jgi:hypothetical protein